MITRFLLQHTRYPVQPDEVVPDVDWHTMSRHISQSAADKALGRAYGRMIEYSGKVSDSFRIVPAKDTVISFSFLCKGYADPGEREFVPCPSNSMEVVTVIWKAKSEKPRISTSRLWHSQFQCGECNQFEKECCEENKNRVVS